MSSREFAQQYDLPSLVSWRSTSRTNYQKELHLRKWQIENSIFSQSVVRDFLFIARATDNNGTFMAKFNSNQREESLREYAAKLSHSPYVLMDSVDTAYQRLSATAETLDVQRQWAIWRNESLVRLANVFFDQGEWETAVDHRTKIRAINTITAIYLRRV